MRAALASVCALACACGAGNSRVTRVVDGRTVEGRFIAPEAYALFLRGAIAESGGVLEEAIRAYEAVASVDDDDAEVFARIARVRCARDPHDPRAKAALEHAFALDSDYGPAWSAAATCGLDSVGALGLAARFEPRDASVQVAYARALERSSSANVSAARATLLELSLEQPTSSEAMSALSSWADAHDDLDLLVLSLVESSRRVPRLDDSVARTALALAREGQLVRARRVAAALLDARARRDRGGPPLDEATRASLGRLAIDEAVAHDDEDALRRRADVARLPLAEAAARAALAARYPLARSVAEATLRADPSDVGARMVLVATDASPRSVTAQAQRTAPAIACGLLASSLLRTAGPAATRSALLAAPCDPIPRDDAEALSLYADLAARDAFDENALPTEARIELAWRRREPLRVALENLDPRHELLARSQNDATSPRTIALATRLARRSPTDPIILAALLSVAHTQKQSAPDLARTALASPANAVLDAALLDTPLTSPERTRVRTRFASLAATPAERALVR